MMIPLPRSSPVSSMSLAANSGRHQAADSRSIVMKWETPQAIDFRFGMEITMYIANR
jgi:coenzyme PQQ precursor peptide PqqA